MLFIMQGLRGSIGSDGTKGEKGNLGDEGSSGPAGKDGQQGIQVRFGFQENFAFFLLLNTWIYLIYFRVLQVWKETEVFLVKEEFE